MKTVRLTVNGEPCSAAVPGRTQLAELLRDHLHLTGTHLGCEHGVCGACTVLVDGKPVRSCITWAQACEGTRVVTVEGLGDDPVGRALREAFTRHHALQCGFCTPGMLITAWDVVTRLAPTSEVTIRRELSGNLCRCTGYMGIVAAVRDVARQRRGEASGAAATAPIATQARDEAATAGTGPTHGCAPSEPPTAASGGGTTRPGRGPGTSGGPGGPDGPDSPGGPDSPDGPGGSDGSDGSGGPDSPGGPDGPGGSDEAAASPADPFEPFEVDPTHLAGPDTAPAGAAGTTFRPMTRTDGWTLVEREFVIGHPVDTLWALFEDVPRVAQCLPGVEVESAGPDRIAGRAEIRFGPIGASFHGEGTRETDAGRRTGVITGHGSDRRGHASLDAELRYAMSGEDAADSEPRTRVDLAIRFRVQGGLAQFNRGDLVESFADVMLAEFVGNCERRLAGKEVRAAAGAGGFAILWRMIRARLGL